MQSNLKIGDIISEEEFKELSRLARDTTFNGKTYMLKQSYEFKRIDKTYEVVSTFESRIEDSNTGHAAIHRPERKMYSGYYNNKS